MTLDITRTGEGGVVIKAVGVISGQELLNANLTLCQAQCKQEPFAYQLMDFLEADKLTITSEEIRVLAGHSIKSAEYNPAMVLAVVTSKDHVYGLARMWQAYLGSSPIKSGVFKDMEQAKQWIKVNRTG